MNEKLSLNKKIDVKHVWGDGWMTDSETGFNTQFSNLFQIKLNWGWKGGRVALSGMAWLAA